MNDEQIVIHGTFKILFKGLEIFVIHVAFEIQKEERHYFLVHYPGDTIAIAKFKMEDEIRWSGSDNLRGSEELGRTIETHTGIQLPVQPFCNPFMPGNSAEKIDIFHIGGSIIEKTVVASDQADEIYYRVRMGDEKKYLLTRFRLPLNNNWEWLPCNKMTEEEFRYLTSTISEYESGDFERQNRLNQVLLKLLRSTDKSF